MKRDIMNLAVVNLKPVWGDKAANYNRIKEYAKCAAKKGIDMIVFPEMALTGYDIENIPKDEMMQIKEAEYIPGPSTEKLSVVAQKYGIYIIFGMPEKDKSDEKTVYNSAAILKPDGTILSYQKIHLPGNEADWATRGNTPMVFDTEWGKVGLTICYDTYRFRDLAYYMRAKGARLLINCTACCFEAVNPEMIQRSIEGLAVDLPIYVASSNLTETDKFNHFMGCSSIVGPASKGNVYYYAGYGFKDDKGRMPGMFYATIDLELVNLLETRPLFNYNPRVKTPDYRPEIYLKMNENLLKDQHFMSMYHD